MVSYYVFPSWDRTIQAARQILDDTGTCWFSSSGAGRPYAATGGGSGLTLESAYRCFGCRGERSGRSHSPGPLRLSAAVAVLGEHPARQQPRVRVQLTSDAAPI